MFAPRLVKRAPLPLEDGGIARVCAYLDQRLARPGKARKEIHFAALRRPDVGDLGPTAFKFIQDHGSSLLTEEFYTDQTRITAETILPLIR